MYNIKNEITTVLISGWFPANIQSMISTRCFLYSSHKSNRSPHAISFSSSTLKSRPSQKRLYTVNQSFLFVELQFLTSYIRFFNVLNNIRVASLIDVKDGNILFVPKLLIIWYKTSLSSWMSFNFSLQLSDDSESDSISLLNNKHVRSCYC